MSVAAWTPCGGGSTPNIRAASDGAAARSIGRAGPTLGRRVPRHWGDRAPVVAAHLGRSGCGGAITDRVKAHVRLSRPKELVLSLTSECSSSIGISRPVAVDLNPIVEDQYGEGHDGPIGRRLESWNMTLGRYIESITLSALVIASLGVASVSLRRKALPTWFGPPARLLEVIFAISLMVVVSQALGTVGLFRLGWLVVTLVLVALVALWFAKIRPSDHTSLTAAVAPSSVASHSRQEVWWEPVAAILAVGLVAAEWGAGTIHALRDGVSGIDSLWYHMPISAGFVQSGSVASLHNINNDNVIEFYPATSEMLHAVGILLFGSDFLSPLINAMWLALALFSAWCLGRRYGVGSLTTMAAALVLGTTEVIADEPGTAYNDLVGTALVLAALALLAYVDVPWGQRGYVRGLWTVAMAAGLAIGVKDTFVFPVAALTVGVIALLPRGQRARQGLLWCFVVAVTGGFWYARNIIYAGNPVPNVNLGLGSFQLPSSPGDIGTTISGALFSGRAWTHYFVPGLGQALGPAWLVLVVITAAGLTVGTVGGLQWTWRTLKASRTENARRAQGAQANRDDAPMTGFLALVGIATLLGYLVTPQPNLPGSFVYDLRFSLLTFLAGAIALPVAFKRASWVPLLALVFGGAMIATQFAGGIWFGNIGQSLVVYHSISDGLLVGVPVLVVGVGVLLRRRLSVGWLGRGGWIASIVLVLAVIAGGLPLQRYHQSHWYVTAPYPRIDRWASTVLHARIGVATGFLIHYPLFGPGLTNDVRFVGTSGPHGTYSDIQTCAGWRQAMNAGRFEYVLSVQNVLLNGKVLPSPSTWLRTDPTAKEVFTESTVFAAGYERLSVFAIHGAMPKSGCVGG